MVSEELRRAPKEQQDLALEIGSDLGSQSGKGSQ